MALGLLGGAGIVTGKAEPIVSEDDPDTVKMLTPDGRLVEIERKHLPGDSDRAKVRNKDILAWRRVNDQNSEEK